MNVLIVAMPGIVASSGSSVKCDVKLVIVGEGSVREQLKKDAAYPDKPRYFYWIFR